MHFQTDWVTSEISPVCTIQGSVDTLRLIDSRINDAWKHFESTVTTALGIAEADCHDLVQHLKRQVQQYRVDIARQEIWIVNSILKNLDQKLQTLAKNVITNRKAVWAAAGVKSESAFQTRLIKLRQIKADARSKYHSTASVCEQKKLDQQQLVGKILATATSKKQCAIQQSAANKVISQFWNEVRTDPQLYDKMEAHLQRALRRLVSAIIHEQADLAFAPRDARDYAQDTSILASVGRWESAIEDLETEAIQQVRKQILLHIRGSQQETMWKYVHLQMQIVLPALRRQVLQQAIKGRIAETKERIQSKRQQAEAWKRDDAALAEQLMRQGRAQLQKLSDVRCERMQARLEEQSREVLAKLESTLKEASSSSYYGGLVVLEQELADWEKALSSVKSQSSDHVAVKVICPKYASWPWRLEPEIILNPKSLPAEMRSKEVPDATMLQFYKDRLAAKDRRLKSIIGASRCSTAVTAQSTLLKRGEYQKVTA